MVFQVYPSCPAQAVNTAFYWTFPEIKEWLVDSFKRYLSDLVTIWISGTYPLMIRVCSGFQTDRLSIFDIMWVFLTVAWCGFQVWSPNSFHGKTRIWVDSVPQLEIKRTLIMVRNKLSAPLLHTCIHVHWFVYMCRDNWTIKKTLQAPMLYL